VLTAIGWAGSSGTPAKDYDALYKICVGNIILTVAGLIPGYWATFLLIDKVGRKPIQFMGFGMLTIIFCIMVSTLALFAPPCADAVLQGFAYDKLTATKGGQHAFVFLYCLANFFQNFGPNTTTFVVPGEAFPTRYRSTSHGISAASGKLGAIVAQVGFAQLQNRGGPNKFVKHLLEIFAFFMLTGVFSTMLIPETNQRTLEDLSNESQDGFVQGPARPRRGANDTAPVA
jgi:PHS family inorganic phosphate transporter-like MFS transporter